MHECIFHACDEVIEESVRSVEVKSVLLYDLCQGAFS